MTYDHRRKLEEAERHICAVNDLVKTWVLWAFDEQHVDEGQNIVMYVRLKEAVSPGIAEGVGNSLQSLRQSLARLIYALGIHNKPRLTEKEKRRLSFPIGGNANTRSLDSLSVAAKDAVMELVPLKSNNLTDDMLWILDRMANRDKHRASLLHGAASQLREASLPVVPHYEFTYYFRAPSGTGR